MLLICPHCRKHHDIDEKRIPANVKMAKCRSCGKPFKLKPSGTVEVLPDYAVGARKKTPGTRKIGVSLSKGGVGKSTTAVNLASGLALAGFKVLLVDTDTQGQDSFMLGVKPRAGLTEMVTGEVKPEEALVQARDKLWLLAGGKSLAGLKRVIDRKDFGGELTLAESLAEIDKQYDYVVIDTSPGWDPLTVNVLFYVEELMAPVSLEVMTMQGLVEFLKSIASIQKYRKEVTLKYLVPTFKDDRVTKSMDVLDRLQELYKPILCDPICYNASLSEAPGYGQTIYEYAPGSPGAQDYRKLVRRVAEDDSLLR